MERVRGVPIMGGGGGMEWGTRSGRDFITY